MYNKHQISDFNRQKAERQEKKQPLLELTRMINMYHSVDLMNLSDLDRQQAKNRLHKRILGTTKSISPNLINTVKSCLKNKDVWENVRESWF